MTKNATTARRERPAAAEEKAVQVASPEPTVQEDPKPQPRVKRIAEEVKAPETTPETAPKVRSAVVELVEGSSYEIRGTRFLSRRPVVVTDQRILSAVEVNSRFRVTDAEGGK